jgi:3-phosphoshikimate 1-carboxyvinyltransferase
MPALRVYPQTEPLTGTVRVPGDKSISHRAVMLAALANGESTVRHWLPAGDTLATLAAVRALGVPVRVARQTPQAWELAISGVGMRGLRPPGAPLNCQNAGTGLRLLAGILAGQGFPVTLDGSDQLRRRPMRRITAPLRQMGALIADTEGKAPLHLEPARLRGIDYAMPVASAQVKSALLLAGLYAEGDTVIHEPGPARDHTERMLRAMGAPLTVWEGRVRLSGPVDRLAPLDLTVPADISSAAFVLVAAGIVPGSSVTLTEVGVNETRTGVLAILDAMGAALRVEDRREAGAGEPIADLVARYGLGLGVEIGGPLVVRAIDEFPVLAVAATQAQGSTHVRDAAELRVKEVDRIAVLAGELRKMGAGLIERPDGFTVNGPIRLRGARVDSHEDHRLGMALAIAALVAEGETTIERADSIGDSFPDFVETMGALGARLEWC